MPQAAPQLRPFQDSDLQDAYQLDQACFPPGVAYSRSELGAYARMRNAKAWVAELARLLDAKGILTGEWRDRIPE